MQVPKRKAGQYTFDKKDPHMTEDKFRDFKNKLERLKKIRPELINEVKRLALDGDFSENHAYSLAKGRLRGINQGILDLEKQLKNAVIIKKSNSGRIEIGSMVELEINGRIKEFTILGSSETNPSTGIISHLSPIGEALMGKKTGDQVEVELKDKTVYYKIIKIR